MTRFEQAETLQNLLVAHATGGSESESEYVELRQLFVGDAKLARQLPNFVTTNRTLYQFWQFIKYKFSTYRERRDFIWSEFAPLLKSLESPTMQPCDSDVSQTLDCFDTANVHAAWAKALERRNTDPDGAITASRTLLESTCKHILDEQQVSYDDTAELPKLYKACAEALTLAPSQHSEQVFKQVLGGCTAVVEGLGSLRNRLSDAHGRGKSNVRPSARHAELVVNLAGAMAAFLVATFEARRTPTK